MVTVRTVLSIAASKGWILYQMDANNALLQGDLYEEVYMMNIKLTDALVGAGYQQSAYDHSLLTKQTSHDIVIILVYVDDLLITSSNISLVEDAKNTLHNSFKVKDLGELRYFLGIEVMRSDQGILLNQRKYALELISSTVLAAAKPTSTPIKLNQKLTTIEYDKHVGHNGDEELQDVGRYQRLVGQYIKGSPGLGIFLKKGPITHLSAFYDSDWAACPNTRRSITGYVFKLGDSLLSWKSKKQQIVSRSSAEA
ncbi:PREDICTED: uncharacterized protein LOC109206740 [Nicotiana attenuata]|uniref:uncharacterized protein LOC109206740 n=1 Tax=Nicotiana attenuata TaxID=49451 RepID=UPI00090494B1|nr:PREDICTED: uncharacterized protein LOC109206740 [Nicotiana attenuata]